MTESALLYVVLSAAAIALWAVGLAVPLNETNRYRAFALASIATLLVAGLTIGWSRAVPMGMLVAWVTAIVRGVIKPPVLAEEPVHHAH